MTTLPLPNKRLHSGEWTGTECKAPRSSDFFSSLKAERTAPITYRTGDQAKAAVFNDIKRFYNPRWWRFTLGYLSRMKFERQATEIRMVSIKPAAARIANLDRQSTQKHNWGALFGERANIK